MGNVIRLPNAPIRVAPGTGDLARIPMSRVGEYDLSDADVKRTRALIYGINKDGIRRYRTLRENGLLMVWRIK